MKSYKDILDANLNIEKETHQNYGKGLQQYENVINLFVKIIYNFANSKVYKDFGENFYKAHVLYQYYDLSMSFRGCISLMEQGLYADAFKLIRSLLENLVKIKYFYKNQDLFESFETGKRIQIAEMFKGIGCEDAYKIIYKFLSKFEHSNVGAKTTQINQFLLKDQFISLVPLFNPMQAQVIINFLMYLLYGYLNFAKIFFSYDEKLDDQGMKKWLRDQVLKHKEIIENTEWYKAMNLIVSELD